MAPAVDPSRLAFDLEALKRFTLPDQPYTRRAFTPLYREARGWLERRMRDAGLEAEIDAAGNLVGRRGGGGPAVLLGSHIDTVPGGGLYDGVAGVVAALEVARLAADAVLDPPFALEVVDFLSEEPSDFGVSCVGSRGLAGELTPADLARTDPRGRTLETGIREMGGRPERLGSPLRPPGAVRAYLELHIEQGPRLEAARRPVGIVTGIVGIRRYQAAVRGRAGHAGTTPMDARRDALTGAAELVLLAESTARRLAAAGPFVATTGAAGVLPGAINVVPAEVRLEQEARALEESRLDDFDRHLREGAARIAAARDLQISIEERSRSAPVAMDRALQELLVRASGRVGARTLAMPSGAGHDAQHLAALGPAAMLFIPCRGGLSHCPEEHAELKDLATGASVLWEAVRALAEGER